MQADDPTGRDIFIFSDYEDIFDKLDRFVIPICERDLIPYELPVIHVIHHSGSSSTYITRKITAARQYPGLSQFLVGEGWEDGAPYLSGVQETERMFEGHRCHCGTYAIEISYGDDV